MPLPYPARFLYTAAEQLTAPARGLVSLRTRAGARSSCGCRGRHTRCGGCRRPSRLATSSAFSKPGSRDTSQSCRERSEVYNRYTSISISTFSMAAGTGGGGGGAATPPSSRYTFSSRTSSRVLAAVSSVSRLVVMACRTCQSGVSIPTRVANQVSVFPRACAPGRPRLSPPRPPDTRTPPHRTGRTAVRGGRWCPTTARCPACRRNPRPR